MYRILITILVMVALAGTGAVQATTVDFYTDGFIVVGDKYYYANSYDNAHVEMFAGEVGIFSTYDSSVLNLHDGIIGTLLAHDTSTVNIYGGEIPHALGAYNSATLNLYGGMITVSHGLQAWDLTTVNIYGYGFELTGSGNSRWLSGFWPDGTAFNDIWLRGPETYSRVVLHVIPEPATIGLLALGTVLMRRRKQ